MAEVCNTKCEIASRMCTECKTILFLHLWRWLSFRRYYPRYGRPNFLRIFSPDLNPEFHQKTSWKSTGGKGIMRFRMNSERINGVEWIKGSKTKQNSYNRFQPFQLSQTAPETRDAFANLLFHRVTLAVEIIFRLLKRIS